VLLLLVVAAALAVRLAIPRGLWLDEAISVSQAQVGFLSMLENIAVVDRHPPLHHAVLWLTVRLLGDGELAVRIPSLVAGTLTVPALYLLGRELYDRRTGLLAAAFGAASPLLVWYAQEARMYAFVALLAPLAVWAQARALRESRPRWWAAYVLASAALMWSHYFGLILVAAQQLVFVVVLIGRRRDGVPVRSPLIGWLACLGALGLAVVPLLALASRQFASTGALEELGLASDAPVNGQPLSFYAVLANGAWAVWGYHPDSATALLAAAWPLLLLSGLLLLGRGGSRRTLMLTALMAAPVVALLGLAFVDRELFEVRYFVAAVPLALVLAARLVTGWTRPGAPRALLAGGLLVTMIAGLVDQQLNPDNPRLYDYRGAVAEVRAAAGPDAVLLYAPRDMRYVLEYYEPGMPARRLERDTPSRREAPRVAVLASFTEDPQVARRTNEVVGKLDFERRLLRRMELPNARVWIFG